MCALVQQHNVELFGRQPDILDNSVTAKYGNIALNLKWW